MSEETPKEEIPIEQLSAYSLYLVQESLNEYAETRELKEQNRKRGKGASKSQSWDGKARASASILPDWLKHDPKRLKYKQGDGYSIQDEYRYLLAETDFEAAPGINYEAAAKADAEKAALEAEPNRIDQEYADGIGIVNQALEESTLADDVMGPAVDPTNIVVDADPVSISSPENNAGKLGGINSFKRAYDKEEAATLNTIKNTSINI